MLHLAVPILFAAGLPGVSAQHAPARALELSLDNAVVEHACPGALIPSQWGDSSDAFFFAAGPTARLDEEELHAGVLSPLLNLRLVQGAMHLFVIGSPLRSGLRFTSLGWKPRWPFC